MTEWTSAPLGDLCNLITDGKHGDCNNEDNSGYFFISAKDIRDGRINYENARQIKESDFAETHRRTNLQPGDILLTNSGTIGRLAIASNEDVTSKTTLQKSVAVIKPRTENLLSRFLYYSLAANTNTLINAAGGAAQKNLLLGDLRKHLISFPSLVIQEQISDVLSNYDYLIENNRRRITFLEESARLLYQEWFVHLRFPGYENSRISNGVPDKWELKTLGDVCEEIREAVLPDSIDPNTPYIGLEHIPRRSISLSEWGQASQVTSSKHRFREGEIIFGKIRPYFHKVGIAFVDGIASSDAIIIRPKSNDFSCLVLMTVSSDEFIAVTAQQMREGSKMPRADWKQMQAYNLLIPPYDLLMTFEEIIKPIINQLKTLCFSNQKLSTARDLLLPRLMNGEISV